MTPKALLGLHKRLQSVSVPLRDIAWQLVLNVAIETEQDCWKQPQKPCDPHTSMTSDVS